MLYLNDDQLLDLFSDPLHLHQACCETSLRTQFWTSVGTKLGM